MFTKTCFKPTYQYKIKKFRVKLNNSNVKTTIERI